MTGSRNRTGALRWVLSLALRGRARALVRLGCWSLLEAAPAYLSGMAIARALDAGFLAGRPATGLRWLALLAGAVLLAGWAAHRTVMCLADIVEPVRDRLVRLVVTASLHRATRSVPTADLAGVARLTEQTEIVRESLAGTLTALRGFLFAGAAVLAGLASLHPRLVVVVAPPLLLALAGLALLLRAQVAAQREQVLAEERVAESATRVAAGLRDITACGAEDQTHQLVGRHVDAQAAAAYRLARLKAASSLVVGVGGWLPLALLLVATPVLLGDGVTPGVIAGAVIYLAHSLRPAVQVLVEGLTTAGSWLVTTAGRVREVTDIGGTAGPGERGGPRAGGQTDPSGAGAARGQRVPGGSRRGKAGTGKPARGRSGKGGRPGVAAPAAARPNDLRLRRVSFRYGPHSDPVLRDIDLVIQDGEHLAIAGPSGVGKSTLAGLVCGTLRPSAGEVLLDGVPLASFEPDRLAGRRVVIPQEAYVFAGTVRENLLYHRPEAGERRLDTAVAALGAGGLLRRLGGYDADLEPGALSAGERQLIALTRAYLSPARIAVLDEATCHLDPRAEARVERAFAGRPGTLIVVAHRISSALRARRILVLDGAAPHLGDHESLLLSSPLYRELVGCWDTPAGEPAAQSHPA